MKCQECDKLATFHITELTGPALVELHLCVDHARAYLAPGKKAGSQSLATVSQQLDLPSLAEVVAEVEAKLCPYCGLSFAEFRQQQRLGCAFDYDVFRDELLQLLRKIHGHDRHTGKRPDRGLSETRTEKQLIRRRRTMRSLVAEENYEEASRLHGEIRALQLSLRPAGEDEAPTFLPDEGDPSSAGTP